MIEPLNESQTITVILKSPGRRWLTWLLMAALGVSILFNLGLFAAFAEYVANVEPPYERFHSGEVTAPAKIARLEVNFTIMPPFTDRFIETIEHVTEDDSVQGVLLVINSPGGLVSDSHQIYDKLNKLREQKPVHVAMQGVAASGGYYVAMGGTPEAPIYAEPTTWTGSIGVIIPRYNAKELGEKIGVTSDSIATGPLKDTLNPLKDLTDDEIAVWRTILDDSLDRFLGVIDSGRPKLDREMIEELATGQVYTADQALENGLIDEIGYDDDALQALAEKLGISEYRVVTYEHPKTLAETLLGVSVNAQSPVIDPIAHVLQANTPRAFYLFGWHQGLTPQSF